MLLIGSERRKTGKTTLACKVINKFSTPYDIVAVKITTLTEGPIAQNDASPIQTDRALWEKGYDILEEIDTSGKTDTSKFLASGAQKSFWLKVFDKNLLDGFMALLKIIGEDSIVVCESTSLMKVVQPGIFIMVTSCSGSSISKKYIKDLKQSADKRLWYEGGNLDFVVDNLKLKSGKWKLIDSNCS
jgi:hypothetical protein